MRIRHYITLALLALIFLKCDPGVNFENIEPEKLYSVNSFISPRDTIFQVYLYRALKLGTVADSESALVKDAEIVLTDGIATDTLLFNNDNGRYEGFKKNLVIEPLKTYFLIIQTKIGEIIQASCSVPPNPVTPQVSGSRTDDDYIFNVSWANPDNHKYFVLAAKADGTYLYNSPWGPQTTSLSARLDNDAFPSDQQKEFNNDSGIVRYAFLAETPRLTISLINMDGNMYEYYDTYREYDNWIINSSDNVPNFREPKPIFSNIKNAIGIFAAYNAASITIEIK